MFQVSDVVRNKGVMAGAPEWIEQLPDLVSVLADDWEFTPGPSLEGGTESFVLEVSLADGLPAVLKLLIPRGFEAAGNEITVLQLANGEGCPRLMERLGRAMFDLSIPLLQRHEILCSTAARMWRPAPDCGLPTGADKGRWLIDFITATWEALDRPLPERTIDHALACAERRIGAHDNERPGFPLGTASAPWSL